LLASAPGASGEASVLVVGRHSLPMSWVRAALVACATLLLFTIWLGFGLGGLRTTVAVDDIGEGVASGIAGACCLIAALRASHRSRLGWSLLAAAALAWTAGEIAWSVYEVGMNVAVPFPSVADVGFLLAVPLGLAGLLTLPLAPSRTTTRVRSILDGGIIALSLLFVCWAFVLGPVYQSSGSGLVAQVIGLAYPFGDILTASVVIIIASRATGPERLRFLLLMAGFLANAVADSAFAYLTGAGLYTIRGSVLDAAWVAGFLLITLAALWPAEAAAGAEEATLQPWQVTLPGMAFAAAMLSTLALAAMGHPPAANMAVLLAALGLLLITSHLISVADSTRLRRANAVAEAMLQRLNVPLGGLPVAAFELDPQGRLARAHGPLFDGLQKSETLRTQRADPHRPISLVDSTRITQLETEVGELRQVNSILQRLAGFDRTALPSD